ncbi:MAG: hypothetical protein QOJ79_2611 [Actinomycetota bacterium]|jgi:hypothetical protein|nr:hypothetical protein [Actinomycetota bacterium]
MRAVVRSTLLAGMTGVLMVSVAWAGIGISPTPGAGSPTDLLAGASGTTTSATDSTTAATPSSTSTAALGAGQVLVGAAKASMAPRPADMAAGFPGARWETDPVKCTPTEPGWYDDIPSAALMAADGIASAGSTWPENPDCIYMGGFGIGPQNPVSSFDKELGLWVRSVAISDGTTPFVMTVVDAEGWFWDYNKKCTDCGAKQISAALAADPQLAALGAKPSSFILHATHSHSAPDFIGGWGFVPNWYMAQITDTIKATAKQALLTMEPATLETGEIEARAFNNERRDTYRAAEEEQISWLRAVAVDNTTAAPTAAAAAPAQTASAEPGNRNHDKKTSPSPDPSPSPTESGPPAPAPPRVIATLGAYAAHPTTRGTNNGVASSDWVGFFEKRLEDRFGGIGFHFMTGLGNMSASGGTGIGTKLADLIPPVGGGTRVTDTHMRVAQTTYQSAVTNVPLDALGTPGFFDRKFNPAPVVVNTGEEPTTAPCTSASPQSVDIPISVVKIGSQIVLTTGGGEEFSNLTNTIKEKNAGKVTFPLAQVNDALGYMPQSFELNPVGQQGLGFVAGGYLFVNYEDSYAIDKCVGDGMLETTLALLNSTN